jgi:hypothetical protein
MRRGDVLKTICLAAALHGAFTIGVPWWLLSSTRGQLWTSVPLGSLRWLGLLGVAFGVYPYLWALVRLRA